MSSPPEYGPSNASISAIPPLIDPSPQNYIPPMSSQRSLIAGNLNGSLMFMFFAGMSQGCSWQFSVNQALQGAILGFLF